MLETTTFVSSTQLTAIVPATQLASSATLSVAAVNGTSISTGLAVSLAVDSPTPTLSSISPGDGVPLGATTTITLGGSNFTTASTAQIDGNPLATTYKTPATLTAQIPASLVALPGNHAITVSTPAPGGGTISPLVLTAYVGIQNNAMALDPANGLLYISVPSSAGAPYGNSVVPVDPATGVLGNPIYVGSEPDKLAISSDGSTLWVGLDGASAVRQVNLQTGTAGMQFSLGDNTGTYEYPPVVHAIAVLPGSPNSIVASVATNNGLYEDLLTIYDSGVARTNQVPLETIASLPAIFVSPTKAEVYATSYETGYQVFSYNSSGLSHLAGNTGTSNFSVPYGTAVQVDNGQAYLDTGVALGAETGTLLGTFYSSGSTVATGPMVSISSLGTLFILESVAAKGGSAPSLTIQAFNESAFTPVPSATIPVNGAISGSKYGAGNSTETELNGNNSIDTLLHWGSNGLAFRAANGVFTFRSNVVQDLSSTNADLSVAVTAPASATAGSSVTFTAAVSNHGPSPATDAVLTQTIPSNMTASSASGSQGTCSVASAITCNLGSLANGAAATITITLQAMTPGSGATTATVAADQERPGRQQQLLQRVHRDIRSKLRACAGHYCALSECGYHRLAESYHHGHRHRLCQQFGRLLGVNSAQYFLCQQHGAASGSSSAADGNSWLVAGRSDESSAGRRRQQCPAVLRLHAGQSNGKPHPLRSLYPAAVRLPVVTRRRRR